MSRLDSPIFVVYVNVNGLARHAVDEKIESLIESFSPCIGETNIFFPIQNGDSRIELLWPGNGNINPNISSNIKSFLKVLDDSFSFIESNWKNEVVVKEEISKLRSSLRNLKIDSLIN
jgi:hypothetical protein